MKLMNNAHIYTIYIIIVHLYEYLLTIGYCDSSNMCINTKDADYTIMQRYSSAQQLVQVSMHISIWLQISNWIEFTNRWKMIWSEIETWKLPINTLVYVGVLKTLVFFLTFSFNSVYALDIGHNQQKPSIWKDCNNLTNSHSFNCSELCNI